MNLTDYEFEYGNTSIADIEVVVGHNQVRQSRRVVKHLVINGETVKDSPRFWQSLYTRYSTFGLNDGIFTLYKHDEVFARLAKEASNDRLRYTIERCDLHPPVALAVSAPNRPYISYPALVRLLAQFGGENITYDTGEVNSLHNPRVNSHVYECKCPYGDGSTEHFRNRYLIQVPIDVYGRPVIYPGIQRVEDGVEFVARQVPAMRHDIPIGKGQDVVTHALERTLEQYNADESFATWRTRIVDARRSWASMNEANSLYKLLILHLSQSHILDQSREAFAAGEETPILMDFHQLTGDLSRIYGVATLDAISHKKQYTLPAMCTVYDLLSFASHIATFRTTEIGRQAFHQWVGRMIGTPPYDLQHTRDINRNFSDFHIRGRS